MGISSATPGCIKSDVLYGLWIEIVFPRPTCCTQKWLVSLLAYVRNTFLKWKIASPFLRRSSKVSLHDFLMYNLEIFDMPVRPEF
jgi:hypothetical protein